MNTCSPASCSCSHQDFNKSPTPLLCQAGPNLLFQYSRLPVTGFRNQTRNESLPKVDDARIEAMNVIQLLAARNALTLPTQRGDIAYINNMCMLHGRAPFDIDSTGQPLASRRHLIKLFLRDPARAWDIPEAMAGIWDHVYGANRPDGSREEHWFLEYNPEQQKFKWATNG